MKAKCIANNINTLPKESQKFAYHQDEAGATDLTIGIEYIVYGTRRNDYGDFYWVLTDEISPHVPWWMPAAFFEVTDDHKPSDWVKDEWEGYGHEVVYANPLYGTFSEDIEDGTPAGYQAFAELRIEAEKDQNSN